MEQEVEDEVVVGEEGGVGEVRVAPVVAGECRAGLLCPPGKIWGGAVHEVEEELAVGAALAYLVVQAWPRKG